MPETKPLRDTRKYRTSALHIELLHGVPVTEPLPGEPGVHHGRIAVSQALLEDGQPSPREPHLALVRRVHLRAHALASPH
jgi:hypothetical protein